MGGDGSPQLAVDPLRAITVLLSQASVSHISRWASIMTSLAQVTNTLSRLRATSRSRLKSKGNRRKLLSPPTEIPQRRVLDIPYEVAQLIAEHLDDASARALCRTSKSLRVAGQLRLWRTLRVIADLPSRSEGGGRNHRRPNGVADEDQDDRACKRRLSRSISAVMLRFPIPYQSALFERTLAGTTPTECEKSSYTTPTE